MDSVESTRVAAIGCVYPVIPFGELYSRKSQKVNTEPQVKMGKTRSRAFRLCVLGGAEDGPYQTFRSMHDPTIATFAAGNTSIVGITVNQGNLSAMLNGKGKRVGIRGRPGMYIQAHPDDVRDQAHERRAFGGKCLSQDVIDLLGTTFKAYKKACKLQFQSGGSLYTNTGQITRGQIDPKLKYDVVRKFNNEYLHTLIYYAHAGADALSERQRQEKNKLVIAHDEKHPLTYCLFRCDPITRAVANDARVLPPMTLATFKTLPKSEQDTYRVLYSNHAETLELVEQKDNRSESAKTHKNLAHANQVYQIHVFQKKCQ